MEGERTQRGEDDRGGRGRRTRWHLAAEAIVLGMLFVAPLARGSVDTPVLLGLAALGAIAAVLLVVGQRDRGVRVGRLAVALLVVTGLTALQLVPLPPAVLAAIAPATDAVLGYARGADPVSHWHPISLDASATARELAKALGFIAAFVVLQHLSSSGQRTRRRVLAVIGGSAALVALIGLAHRLAGADELFGLFSFQGEVPLLTTFGNPNNLAGFLAAGALVSFGLAGDSDDAKARVRWIAAGVVSAVGVVLSESFGGLAALVLGALLMALLRWRAVDPRPREPEPELPRRGWIGFSIAALVALAPLVVIYGGVDLTAPREALDGRMLEGKIYPARVGVSVARSQPLVGTGRGSFETVHPRYLSKPVKVTYTHVENEPIQALAELGLFAGGLLVITFISALFGAARGGRRSVLEAGAAAAVAALLAQSLVDFGLHFASGLVLLALLAAPLRAATRRAARPLALASAGLALATIALAAPWALRSATEDAATVAALASRPGTPFEEVEAAATQALARHPADYLPAENAAVAALALPNGARKALPWLNRVLFLNPFSGRAHELTAEAMARLGRKEQALAEYRQAGELGADVMPRVLARFADPALALQVAPLEPAAAALAAGHLRAKGRLDDAITVLERSLEHSPGALEPIDPLILALELTRRTDRALELAHARRLAHPDDPHAWVMEANVVSGTVGIGDEPARRLFEEALQLFPNDPALVTSLAWHSLSHNLPQQALNDLMALPADLAPSWQLRRHTYRGHAFRDSRAFDEARDEYQAALQIEPEDSRIWLLLARCQLELGAVPEAIAALGHVKPGEPGADALRAELEVKKAARGAEGWNDLLGTTGPATP